MILSGFKFGMLLQIAIGPVCIFIFSNRVQQGFLPALAGVLGVALTDGGEIVLAILGAGALLDKNENLKKVIKPAGRAVIIFFGVRGMLSAFSPVAAAALPTTGGGVFVNAIRLALSNPLTIIFWASIFTTRIAKGDMTAEDRWLFGTGCVLATLFFLSLVAFVGSVTHAAAPRMLIKVLNLVSGLGITAFGVKNLIK